MNSITSSPLRHQKEELYPICAGTQGLRERERLLGERGGVKSLGSDDYRSINGGGGSASDSCASVSALPIRSFSADREEEDVSSGIQKCSNKLEVWVPAIEDSGLVVLPLTSGSVIDAIAAMHPHASLSASSVGSRPSSAITTRRSLSLSIYIY